MSDCSVVSCRSAANRFRSRRVDSYSIDASLRARISSASCAPLIATRRRSTMLQVMETTSVPTAKASAVQSRRAVHHVATCTTTRSSTDRSSRLRTAGLSRLMGSVSALRLQMPVTRSRLDKRSEPRRSTSSSPTIATAISSPADSSTKAGRVFPSPPTLTSCPSTVIRWSSKSRPGSRILRRR